MTTPELDPVEKAREAFEAMTKAVLDAGRQYEERMNAATTALTAEVERLREERDEFERRYSTVLRNLNVAQQERDRLRAGIEALAGDPTAQDETGTWIDRKRVADLLAGSGEQPGEGAHTWQGPCCVECEAHVSWCDNPPAPVAADEGWRDDWINADADEIQATVPRESPVTLDSADVGQGVTAGEDQDGLLPIEREVADFLWQKWRDPDNPAVLIHEDPRTVARHLRPYLRAAVRPTGQEQADAR